MLILINTLLVVFVFLMMAVGYHQKRKGRSYATGKRPSWSYKNASYLSKMFFVFGSVVTLISYWGFGSYTLVVHENLYIQFFGACLAFVGCLLWKKSLKDLGNNYSPLFDAFLPGEIVSSGVYKYIRHPVYLFNLFVSFGFAISSGSLWVFLSAAAGLWIVIRTIFKEESDLVAAFPSYKLYAGKTWRLIPYIF